MKQPVTRLGVSMVVLAALGLAGAGLTAEPPAPRASARQLSWLEGTWAGKSGAGRYEEHWTRPVGGIMIGYGRQTAGDRSLFHEFLKILEKDDGVFYVAQVGTQPEVAFRLTYLSEREAIFENPTHDFPRRLLYRLEKDGTLFIQVTGEQAGKPVTDEYRLTRISGRQP